MLQNYKTNKMYQLVSQILSMINNFWQIFKALRLSVNYIILASCDNTRTKVQQLDCSIIKLQKIKLEYYQ